MRWVFRSVKNKRIIKSQRKIKNKTSNFWANIHFFTSRFFSVGGTLFNSEKAQQWPRLLLANVKKISLALNINDELAEVPVEMRNGKYYARCQKCRKFIIIQRGTSERLLSGNFLTHFFTQHFNKKPPYPK